MLTSYQLHFFHGFLGEPDDWQPLIANLKHSDCVAHDLKDDFQILPRQKDPFKEWAELKEAQLLTHSEKKILIGYSMGGRLCLHLDPSAYDKLILIAAHPGIVTDYFSRQSQDERWAELLLTLEERDWLYQWNAQDVFQNDKSRPQRKLAGHQEVLSALLLSWSLARQQKKDEFISLHKEKIYWICGSEDQKFQTLKGRMSTLLEPDHLIDIPSAGHGVIFDQPAELARIIQQVSGSA